MENNSANASGFAALGVASGLLDVLTKRGITAPTPIQHQAIPKAIDGKDLIGIAQTGTGKTFAFGLPMLQRLAQSKGRCLIVVPTRELAYQVEEALLPFAAPLKIGMAVFVGGASMHLQRKMLQRNPRILVATPGRLNDHLEQRTVTLREVEVLILDEADRMLDMGFKPQIDRILAHVPRERQTLLFSATMPQAIVKLAEQEMQFPLRIEVAPAGTAATKVEQELIIVRQEGKKALLASLLREHEGSVLVFSRTKHGAKNITRLLNADGFKAAEIHANRSLAQRREALEGFKKGRYRILVATDIAARGIDVTDITVVINFDLPDDAADYVHRIGRTGRAGKTGRAISFATPGQAHNIRDIERLIRGPLRRSAHAAATGATLDPSAPPSRPQRRGGKPGGGFRRYSAKGPRGNRRFSR